MATRVEGVRVRKQLTKWTCGPASIRIIFGYYGVPVAEQELVERAGIRNDGTSNWQISYMANRYGFKYWGRYGGTIRQLEHFLKQGIPILICYQDYGRANGLNGHFAVLTGIDSRWVEIADPANHNGTPVARAKRMHRVVFLKRWFEMEDGIKTYRWFGIIRPRGAQSKGNKNA